MPNLPTEFLAAAMTADKRTLEAALRVLRGEKIANGPHFITGAAAARLLGVGRTTFRQWARRAGLTKCEVFPGCTRYRRADVEAIAHRAGGE